MYRFFLMLLVFGILTHFLACQGTREGESFDSALPQSNSRLDLIKERKKLICGIGGDIPGFSVRTEKDRYSGFDVDICRAIAAALFDDSFAVEYVELSTNDRFSALATGDVDILSRTATFSLKRDAAFQIDFPAPVIYDGQSIMVRADSGIRSLVDFKDKSICVDIGTTTELNLHDEMSKHGIKFYPLKFLNTDDSFKAYEQKRCDGVTTDRSQLFAKRATLKVPDRHLILKETLSKEPLTPAVTEGDFKWFQVVRWVIYALIEAEESEITSQNIEAMKTSINPKIRRFLGIDGDLGESLNLPDNFTERIIRHVGNYGEIYDRNLGKYSPFKIPRGTNDLWSKGGLHYAPPFR